MTKRNLPLAARAALSAATIVGLLSACGTAPEQGGDVAETSKVKSAVLGSSGNDFDALVAPDTINHAVGFFPTVTNVKSVYTVEKNGNLQDAYSLQMNSNNFPTAKCSGHPGCMGWQQFVYTNHGDSADWGIEYFLLGWGACPGGQNCCPDTWKYNDTYLLCTKYISGVQNGQSAPVFDITQLAGFKIQADATSASDTMTIYFPDGSSPPPLVTPSQAGLVYGWNEAGFNVFGYNGGQAIFNAGATIKVETDVSGWSTVRPRCGFDVTSAETTNLTLVNSSCCASFANGPRPPGITFTESNLSPLPEPDFCLLNDITPVGFALQ